MSHNHKEFAEYLQSVVKLETLERMTQDLDAELADSQRIMNDIKGLFELIPNNQNAQPEPSNNNLRHVELSSVLDANVPKLLMPDMMENSADVDLDEVIATMKRYAEDLKKNFVMTQPQPERERVSQKMDHIDIEQYAHTLEQLGKRLANIKLNKKDEGTNKNAELESKLTHLCDDVNMFSQLVQAKTAMGESNTNWTPLQIQSAALHYDNLINRLLSGINEVIYMLQNKN